MSMFKKTFARALNYKTEVTDTDLSIMLKFLDRDKRAIVYDHEASTLSPLNPRGLIVSDRQVFSFR